MAPSKQQPTHEEIDAEAPPADGEPRPRMAPWMHMRAVYGEQFGPLTEEQLNASLAAFGRADHVEDVQAGTEQLFTLCRLTYSVGQGVGVLAVGVRENNKLLARIVELLEEQRSMAEDAYTVARREMGDPETAPQDLAGALAAAAAGGAGRPAKAPAGDAPPDGEQPPRRETNGAAGAHDYTDEELREIGLALVTGDSPTATALRGRRPAPASARPSTPSSGTAGGASSGAAPLATPAPPLGPGEKIVDAANPAKTEP